MTIGKIESVTKSKSGKSWRVKIGSEFYGANFDTKIDSALGKSVDFTFGSTDFGKWIESWDYARQDAVPAGTTDSKPASNGDRFYMPFVSNICAHAIASGQIKEPSQISPWAKAAYDAAQALDTL